MSNLIRWEPARDFMTLREAMDHLFDDAFTRPLSIRDGWSVPASKNIDLTLLTSRSEISASLRQLVLKVGADMYIRNYLNSDFSFIGTQLDIIRKF